MSSPQFVMWLINFLSQNRPIVIAMLCTAIIILLFRPRPKPTGGEGREGQSSGTTQASRSASMSRRSVVISTNGILLRFSNGRPCVISEMVKPLQELAGKVEHPSTEYIMSLMQVAQLSFAMASGRLVPHNTTSRGLRCTRKGDSRRPERRWGLRRGQVTTAHDSTQITRRTSVPSRSLE